MRYLPTLIMVALLLSCSAESGSTVRLVSVARDYSAYGDSNRLRTPPEDQKVLGDELLFLSTGSGMRYEETDFLEEDGVWTVNLKGTSWDTDTVLGMIASIEAADDDLFVFHYSGHGTSSGSIVVDDSSYLGLDELVSVISEVGGKKLVLLDSCYSGAAVSDTALSDGETFSGSKLVSSSVLVSAGRSFQLLFSGGDGTDLKDTWVFAASTDGQYSFDSWDTGEDGQEDHGAFTYQVLKALGYDFTEGIPGRSGETITLYGIYSTVMDNMPSDLRTVSTPQVTLSPIDLVLF